MPMLTILLYALWRFKGAFRFVQFLKSFCLSLFSTHGVLWRNCTLKCLGGLWRFEWIVLNAFALYCHHVMDKAIVDSCASRGFNSLDGASLRWFVNCFSNCFLYKPIYRMHRSVYRISVTVAPSPYLFGANVCELKSGRCREESSRGAIQRP